MTLIVATGESIWDFRVECERCTFPCGVIVQTL